MILAIDPGNERSAYVVWDGQVVLSAETLRNDDLLETIVRNGEIGPMVIEMIASYGMAVGKTVFETVFWIGRFCEAYGGEWHRVFRKDVKMHLCGSMRAKDSNISQALRDRFGEKPTKTRPNPVYGDIKLKSDEWQAFGLAVTWWDCHKQVHDDLKNQK